MHEMRPDRELGRETPEGESVSSASRKVGGVGGAALALIALTSCASLSPDAAAASDVVSRFSAAVGAGDGEAACDLLTEPAQRSVALQSGTGCASGIVSLGLALDDARATLRRTARRRSFHSATVRRSSPQRRTGGSSAPSAACRRARRRSSALWTGADVRTVFLLYAVIVVVGLASFFTIGALHR